jgi:hypothetical protein
VVTLRVDRGIEPLLGQLDRFIDPMKRAVRIRTQGWIVDFRHGVVP